MLQIKTVHDTSPAAFDKAVNDALAEGWALTRRLTGPGPDFVAELEREVITEAERTCENCLHADKGGNLEPCCNCASNADKWEPMEGLTAL